MRVAFLTPWDHPCGIADYSQHLVGALREFAEVRVVALAPRYRRGLVEALRHRAEDLRYYRALGEQLNDADLAHIQFQYPLFGGFAPWKLKFTALMERVRVPVVMTMHELEAPDVRSLNMLQRQLYFHAASVVTWPQLRALIVHTRALVEPLRNLMVPAELIRVQPMPVPALPALPATDEAKARLGLSGRRVLAMLGFVVQRKGHEYALAVLPGLPPEVTLAIVGGRNEFDRTDYFDRLQRIVAEDEQLCDRVVITGYVSPEDFHLWLAATEVVLAPFEAMSGSSSLALALAAGKPIVASRLPGLEEMNDLAPCLALADRPGGKDCRIDLNGFDRQLRRVLEDAEYRQSLGQGASLYRERASLTAVARATAAVYAEVME